VTARARLLVDRIARSVRKHGIGRSTMLLIWWFDSIDERDSSAGIEPRGSGGRGGKKSTMAIARPTPPYLFCFGLGYTAEALALRLAREGWRVGGTVRASERRQALAGRGIEVTVMERDQPLEDPAALLAGVTDVVHSIPPDEQGDVVFDQYLDALAAIEGLRWFGYLSTTGVYGDTGGAEVDETAPTHPASERSRRRVDAEAGWLAQVRSRDLPVHVFRLAGIYGPGRSAIDQIRAGRARRMDRPGYLFSRIHVDDIAGVLRASMARPDPGRIYNVCDDLPAAQSEVIGFACELLGVEPPAVVPFAEAAPTMSPMALSFWQDRRRVSNARIKKELAVRLAYPDYRAGLRAILDRELVG
jgi:nucleoside-diphosphate-sugar epimerase